MRGSTTSPLAASADGLHLAVRLTPRARGERVEGVASGMLKVFVPAPPVDNKANEALLRLLATYFRLPRRSLSIAGGAKSRNKTVLIAGASEKLMQRLATAIATVADADAG